MQGWSQFKQSKLDEALQSFFAVLDVKVAGQGDGTLESLQGLRHGAGAHHHPRTGGVRPDAPQPVCGQGSGQGASGGQREHALSRQRLVQDFGACGRECLDGLAPLVEHFLDSASRQIGCALPKLAPQAFERMAHYHWPGNVRQLENVLFQAVSLCDGGTVKAEHIRLPDYGVRQPLGDFSLDGSLDEIVGRFEKAVLERLYSEHPSSRQLGKRLGVSHTTIANKLRDYGLGKESAGKKPEHGA